MIIKPVIVVNPLMRFTEITFVSNKRENQSSEYTQQAYPNALKLAMEETKLNVFPQDCPYSILKL
jgi:hypothetical protein